MPQPAPPLTPDPPPPAPAPAAAALDYARPDLPERPGLLGLSPHQWKSGAAAWLGWLFDGLDMHL